ncbi:hypothetical protein ACF061_33575 [Streptomyces sp. NPDC015220]|uniref:hypothetical protein n=1 Tax=Streptomyces sp. NPDC015220 TaxID=3364947 RepID=UPI0036FCB769
MSEQQGRDWVGMAPADFDLDAPLRLAVSGGPVPVPAEPDDCGTQPLFGEEPPARLPGRRRSRRPVQQDRLF